ncbi:hypothetical protein LTS10_011468 [Elasticomyces elasticus]|nr:hypothetical protein LTS10_011468 [Elasticomyces elasticus]
MVFTNNTQGGGVPDDLDAYGQTSVMVQGENAQRSRSTSAFHSQFDNVKYSQRANPMGYGQYPGAFDMSAMGTALPRQPQYDEGLNVFSPASVYQMQHAAQYASQRGHPQFPQHHHPGQMQIPGQSRGAVMPPQAYHMPPDMFGYGMPQHSPVDTRFMPPGYAYGEGMKMGHGQFDGRSSESAVIPAFPRGPPRKPRQSGHALWVGNLPPNASVSDLKDHFSRDATKDIDSIFLISKSNCAFVNYRSEPTCIAAMNRFHDSRFGGVRLVCRLRRGSTTSTHAGTIADTVAESPEQNSGAQLPDGLPDGVSNIASYDDESPVIVGQGRTAKTPELEDGVERAPLAAGTTRTPEKYFIIKSLTVQDLEASVRNGTWATQSHNEEALNSAFNDTDNVYLIFSANKSGEYFGYARMASIISGEPVNLGGAPENDEPQSAGTPQSIPTPATETAPKGRIIDDSARGSIFWEADHTPDDEEGSPTKDGADAGDGSQWGRSFKIEWQSTARLPFFRTRGLRNPWNANREVKIARDGTEIEPQVGRRLVSMFHSVPSPGGMPMSAGMPVQYR